MRKSIFILTILSFTVPSIGQIKDQDKCKEVFDCYRGRLEETFFDSAYFSYTISNDYSYIEFELPHFGRSNAKYRVEKLSSGDVFIVTKTYLYSKSAQECFLAIDSTMGEKINMKKKGLQYLKREKVYLSMKSDESIILYYMSKYIDKYNLRSNFLNFNPKSFVAWLKVKS